MKVEVLKAVISLLETTLGNMSASDADDVVRGCIKVLKALVKDETNS